MTLVHFSSSNPKKLPIESHGWERSLLGSVIISRTCGFTDAPLLHAAAKIIIKKQQQQQLKYFVPKQGLTVTITAKSCSLTLCTNERFARPCRCHKLYLICWGPHETQAALQGCDREHSTDERRHAQTKKDDDKEGFCWFTADWMSTVCWTLDPHCSCPHSMSVLRESQQQQSRRLYCPSSSVSPQNIRTGTSLCKLRQQLRQTRLVVGLVFCCFFYLCPLRATGQRAKTKRNDSAIGVYV